MNIIELTVYASLLFGTLSWIILFFIGMWTNALTELKAKIGRKNLVYIFRPDKRMDVRALKFIAGGYEDKEYGDILVSEDSTYVNNKGTGVNIVYASYGATLPPKVIKGISRLKELGYNNINQLEEVVEEHRNLLTERRELEELLEQKIDDNTRKQIEERLNEISDRLNELTPKIQALDETIIQLLHDKRKHETIRIGDIVGFFRYNINPNFVRAHKERAIAIALKDQRKLNITLLLAVVLVLAFASTIILIILKGQGLI